MELMRILQEITQLRDSVNGTATTRPGNSGIQQWASAGKAVLDFMPVGNLRFAELPTEKNDFFPQLAGKIEQSLLHAFAHTAMLLDLIDSVVDLLDQVRDLTVLL
jgi:hypothetical protein